MKDRLPLIVGILFASLGVMMFLVGTKMLYNTKNFIKIAKETQGVVTGFDVNVSEKEDLKTRKVSSTTAYYPKIKFTDSRGKQIEFISKYGSSDPGIVEGDTVSVLYDPEHPNKAKWNTKMALWFGPGMLFGFGLLGSIVGLVIIIFF